MELFECSITSYFDTAQVGQDGEQLLTIILIIVNFTNSKKVTTYSMTIMLLLLPNGCLSHTCCFLVHWNLIWQQKRTSYSFCSGEICVHVKWNLNWKKINNNNSSHERKAKLFGSSWENVHVLKTTLSEIVRLKHD